MSLYRKKAGEDRRPVYSLFGTSARGFGNILKPVLLRFGPQSDLRYLLGP
jgi:hypothetical protein